MHSRALTATGPGPCTAVLHVQPRLIGRPPAQVPARALTHDPPLQDVAASYAVGAVGGLLYLRLLGRSVDSVGGGGGGGLGQPRLLIPVILVLVFNRRERFLACCMSSSLSRVGLPVA